MAAFGVTHICSSVVSRRFDENWSVEALTKLRVTLDRIPKWMRDRAATELGRGQLSQVFIEGADGYVLLMAAGDRAVLTALAASEAKLGLVLYDMRETAAEIGDILR